LTPDAVEWALVISATLLITSAPMRASPEARLTPAAIDANSRQTKLRLLQESASERVANEQQGNQLNQTVQQLQSAIHQEAARQHMARSKSDFDALVKEETESLKHLDLDKGYVERCLLAEERPGISSRI